MKVYSRLTMRRLWSITALLAQVAFLLPPAWSQQLCPLCSRGAVACHRTAHGKKMAHHCGAMHGHQMPQQASGMGREISGRMAGAPMGCCCERTLPNTTAVASFSLIPPLAVTEAEFQLIPVTFTSNGFSSHTDRGPPAA
jgi:hypothetical protein